MKLRILITTFALVLAPLMTQAAEETQLDREMEEINLAYRRLGRQIKDPTKNADSLQRVAAIREHAQASLKLEPQLKAEVPAAEQAKFVASYQEAMKDFIARVDKLEAALKAGKNDEAAALLTSLKEAQEAGHKQFRKKK